MTRKRQIAGKPSPPVSDTLSGEVSLRAHLEQTGLTLSGKSRALAAIDRLLGGLIGIPAEFFEGIRRRSELRGLEREKLIREQADKLQQLGQGSDLGTIVTLGRLGADGARKQLNREAVFVETMKSLEAPLISDVPDTPESEMPDAFDDWLNTFVHLAEKASSKRLQETWGRVLAGEIRKPNSFGLSAIRIISELEPSLAASFQRVAARRVRASATTLFLIKPTPFQDMTLLEWLSLAEVGLLQDVNAPLKSTIPSKAAADTQLVLQTRNFCLAVTFGSKVSSVSLEFVKISSAGQQIAEILPWEEEEALRAAALSIEGDVGLSIYPILSRSEGKVIPNFSSGEVIRKVSGT